MAALIVVLGAGALTWGAFTIHPILGIAVFALLFCKI